jgi:hypothetical protein
MFGKLRVYLLVGLRLLRISRVECFQRFDRRFICHLQGYETALYTAVVGKLKEYSCATSSLISKGKLRPQNFEIKLTSPLPVLRM